MTPESIRILLFEDNPGDAHLVERYLARESATDFALERVDRVAQGLERLGRDGVDVVLLDLNLPDSRGLETFERVHGRYPGIPLIVMTGQDDRAQAIEAVREGAQDYLVKGKVDTEMLVRAIRYALERGRAEEALRESQERYALAVRGAKDGIWDWNLTTDEIYYSPRWKEVLGYEAGDIGSKPEDWLDKVHPADLENLKRDLAAHLGGRSGHFESEHRILHRDGAFRWVLSRGVAVRATAESVPHRIAGSLTDIHDRKTHEQQLLHDAMHDALTELPNSVLLLDRLSVALAQARRRRDYRFAVLYFDLDRFKSINDTLGHAVGDRLLVAVSRRIQALVRPGDTVARLGGDEFAILANGIEGPSDATRIAERIHDELRRPIDLQGHQVTTSASIGITLSSDSYERPKDLLRDADIAMYRAKSLGRSRYALFDEEMQHHAEELLKLESELELAVKEEQFGLHYQPIVSLVTGQLVGLEALLRWRHPRRDLLLPKDFLPMAEESGLIVPIGWQVLRQACGQMATWHKLLPFTQLLSVSVNVSPRQLAQPDFVERTESILRRTGFHPTKLEVEISEDSLIREPEGIVDRLRRLNELGVRIRLDDFGAGISSLRRLHRLPLTAVKIGYGILHDPDDPENGLGVVRTAVALARSLGLQVIAEGLETRGQLERIRELSCESAQGYYFCRPLEPDDARTLMSRRPRW